MTFKTVCPVKNNQVVVTLPPDFIGKKQVTVFVNDQTENRQQKLDQLKKAANDPLFLFDIREVQDDFDSTDSETLLFLKNGQSIGPTSIRS